MGSALLFAGTQRARTAGGSAGRGLGAAAFMLGGDNRLQYLFYWYDDAGQEVASDGRGWTPIKLHGYQTRTLSALAPSPAARGYRIYVREVIEESY